MLQGKHELRKEMYCNCLYRCRAATQSAVDVCHSREYLMIIEDRAFLRSYDSAPHPPHSPSPAATCLSFSVFQCVAGRAYWRGRGWAKSQTTKLYDREKAWPSMNHSILSGATVQALWEIPVAWCRPQPSESFSTNSPTWTIVQAVFF